MRIGKAWVVAVMCGFMGVGVAGCGDDDSGGNNNQQQDGAVADAAPPTDGSGLDDGAQPDRSDTDWTCAEIGLCAADCGSDLSCIGGCRNHGCQSAIDVYDTLSTCVTQNCLSDCMADPNGQACVDCRNTNCPTEIAACEANTCP